ncbi:hypothetical protein ACTQ49_04255 [Luteococcus sp. Sow4_B9]|uniref:hypothetical protein n=1 Tax=Luteococcus sp. Sow4_B9 TaxID=3438792 RepID=UPI003F9BDCF7
MRRRVANLVLALVGLGLAGYGIWSITNPSFTCRGVEMHPGDVCHKNDFSQMGTDEVQTYEDRVHAARLSQPVVVISGLAMAAFAGYLMRQGEPTEEATT